MINIIVLVSMNSGFIAVVRALTAGGLRLQLTADSTRVKLT
jgi:hypothetical protein